MEQRVKHGQADLPHRTSRTRRPGGGAQPNWIAVRHAREIGGKRWSELEREFGLSRQRIQRRAVREGWRQPGEVVQKATDDFARRFVAREAEAVIEAYRETLDATRRLLALTAAQIQALEAQPSDATPTQLKELAEVVRKIHSVQSDIGGLGRSDVWRGSGESSDSDQDLSYDEIVIAAIEELENSESPD